MRDAGHRTPDAGRRTSDIGHRTSDGEKSKNNISTPQGGGHNNTSLAGLILEIIHLNNILLSVCVPHNLTTTNIYDNIFPKQDCLQCIF